MHYSTFSSGSARKNPHTIWKARDVEQLTYAQKDSVAEGVAQLESVIWSPIFGRWSVQGKASFLDTLNHHRDVVCAVSYADPSHKYTGPYLSYLIGYEIDPHEGIHDDEIELLEEETGRSLESILAEIPSGKIYYFEDYSRQPTEEAKIENARMFRDVLDYFKVSGIGFYGDLRYNTSYRLLNTRYKDDIEVILDVENEGHDTVSDNRWRSVVGYFK